MSSQPPAGTVNQITNVLVANRSEIARRVFATCRALGISTVAVYSDADADSPHVDEADAAVRLAGQAPSETYLRHDLLIEAARAGGADAVHPGYGFLSENAEFARAVADAGLTWIGPPPAAIEAMGSKVESKRIMAEAGVPVLAELDPDEVTEAELPVLVKASAGGGGRGMRVVHRLDQLAEALAGAEAEAGSAFGDATVFCERYVATGRHIEVQILADEHGAVWPVGERECSIQRRHQKVVEEAPSPLVDETMRAELFDAASKAAKAIDYRGAGTVEFLATDDGEFFFLEMNTRLQVEHPVTECTTGIDLVAEQVRIAEGHPLPDPPARQHRPRGHAIEVRLYAETVVDSGGEAEWQPQSGTVHRFGFGRSVAEFTVPRAYGVRVDSGVDSGSTVGVQYDPMLAKVIAWAPTRAEAARMLAASLSGATLHGVATNRDVLVNVLRHPAFLAGETDTSFFSRHGLFTLATPLAGERAHRLSALAAALAEARHNRDGAAVLSGLPSGWRNLPSQPQYKSYTSYHGHGDGEPTYEIAYRMTRTGLHAEGYPGIELVEARGDRVTLVVDGVRRVFEVARYGEAVCVDSPFGPVTLRRMPRFADPEAAVSEGSMLAPMPGAVLRVAVATGDRVEAGQPVLWLEAMKMEHQITAPTDGVVSELNVSTGDQVDLGAVLAVVRPPDEAASASGADGAGGESRDMAGNASSAGNAGNEEASET
ncbi:biotin carboxylase N-terminal domain-containing protein [Haloechinothrix sp. LS1_15]|uniref:acetyl/propionyl/methylcrotonyl-CoA carboxylase subunit alpha n=1 Tax=Haloechinothrix sp. LS1_15 TaxID=2652248 RepID=UPI0029489BCC|nr:biotin carboxylase N-terminal domain-containing protein [Haloechinothrix sp. LS1_15]MDV6014067.1 ATP-grasp domain-containing protein [Haloechinothrix sp. LS1_15]